VLWCGCITKKQATADWTLVINITAVTSISKQHCSLDSLFTLAQLERGNEAEGKSGQ